MVTILADNYFGYCKKEVKTQIGYSANLFGLAEEEHAGGALAFATFNLGDRFVPEQVRIVSANHRFARGARAGGPARQVPPLGLRHRRDLSRDPLHAGGHGDRRPPTGHQLDQQGPGAAPQAPARPDLHPSERLQDPHGQAPRGAELAADRDGARRAPSATSRAPSRAAANRRSARAWSTPSCPGRSTCGASRRTWRWSRRSSAATTTTRAWRRGAVLARSCPRSLARLGDQAAHAQPRRVHAGVQRLAREHSQPRAGAGVRDQALLPAGVGRRLAQPFQRRHHQRRAGARAQVRGPAARRQLSPDRARGERRLADLQAAAGLRRGRQGADGGRHHRLGGGAGAPAGRAPGRVRRPSQPQAGRRTASSGCSSAPTTRSIPGSTGRPRRTWRGPGCSARTSSRSPRPTRGASSRTWRVHDALHAADARARGPERRADRRRLLDLLGPAAADRRQAAPRTRATCRSGPTWRARATGTWRRWARGSTAGCRCTRRCCSR